MFTQTPLLHILGFMAHSSTSVSQYLPLYPGLQAQVKCCASSGVQVPLWHGAPPHGPPPSAAAQLYAPPDSTHSWCCGHGTERQSSHAPPSPPSHTSHRAPPHPASHSHRNPPETRSTQLRACRQGPAAQRSGCGSGAALPPISQYGPRYPGAHEQLKWSGPCSHDAPLRHTPASHADSAREQFGDRPGAP